MEVAGNNKKFMKTKTSWVALVALSGLLAVGTTLQAQNTNAAAGGGERRGGGFGGRSVDERLAQLSEQLTLTEEQKPKVKAILEEQNQKMAGLREVPQEERRDKMTALREEVNKKMKEVLTEEQYKKYEAMPRGGRGMGGRGEGGGAEGRRDRPGGTNAPPANP
jgi:protein CpxP